MPVQQTINIDAPSEIEIIGVSLTVEDNCLSTSLTVDDSDPSVSFTQTSITINNSFGSCEDLSGTVTLFFRLYSSDCSDVFKVGFFFVPGIVEVDFNFDDLSEFSGSLIKACGNLRLNTTVNKTTPYRHSIGFYITVGSQTVHSDDCFYYFFKVLNNKLYRQEVAKEGNSSLGSLNDTGFVVPLLGQIPVGDMVLIENLLYLFPMVSTDIIVVDITNFSIVKTIPFVDANGPVYKVGNYIYAFPKQEGLNKNITSFAYKPLGANRIAKFDTINETFSLISLNSEFEFNQVERYNDYLYANASGSNKLIQLDITTDVVTYLDKSVVAGAYDLPGYQRVVGDSLFYPANNRAHLVRRNLITQTDTLIPTGLSPDNLWGTYKPPLIRRPHLADSYKVGEKYYFTVDDAVGVTNILTYQAIEFDPISDTFNIVPFSRDVIQCKTNLVSTPVGDFWGDSGKYLKRPSLPRAWLYNSFRSTNNVETRNLYTVNSISYLTTTASNQIDINKLNNLNISFKEVFTNVSTNIGILISFDGRNNWGVLTDENTFNIVTTNTNLPSYDWFSTVGVSSMTTSNLQSFVDIDISSYTTLDIAIGMSTSSNVVSPNLKGININATL